MVNMKKDTDIDEYFSLLFSLTLWIDFNPSMAKYAHAQ